MNTKPYNTKEEKMYRVFTDELEAWSSTGAVPSMGNQDIHYYLDLQKERLEKRNLKMEYGMKLRGEHMDEIHHLIYKDQIYTNMLAFIGRVRRYMSKKNRRRFIRPLPRWSNSGPKRLIVVPTVVQSVRLRYFWKAVPIVRPDL